MVNNFERIRDILRFEDGWFYFLQILKRKKENPDIGSNNVVIANYYINTLEKFDNLKLEIINKCDNNNARAYIRLNRCNEERLSFEMLIALSSRIKDNKFKYMHRLYPTICGSFKYEKSSDQTWIIDWDESSYPTDLIEYLNSPTLEPLGVDKIVEVIPTVNGYHVITKKFNIYKFNLQFNKNGELDVHKNNPTVLYSPNKKVLLWLDDIRDPFNEDWLSKVEGYNKNIYDVVWLKDGNQFMEYLENNDIPDYICFDNDMGLESPEGYDCAKKLIDEHMNRRLLKFPKIHIQSANIVAMENIDKLIKNYKHIYALT